MIAVEEQAAEPVVEPTPRKRGKKHTTLGMRPHTERAVREIFEREKQRLPKDYKEVAARHGVSWRSLKEAVHKVRKGLMHLGLPNSVDELAVDAAVEHQRGLRLCIELEQILHANIEAAVRKLRNEGPGAGGCIAYRDLGVHVMISDLTRVDRMRKAKEERYFSIMREANREKEVKSAIADVETEVRPIDPLSDEDRAMREVEREMGGPGAREPVEAVSAA